MSSARQELLRLLATKSFRLGEFKLSSGATSDYYIDCRTTTLDARGAQLTGQVFLAELRLRGWNVRAISGQIKAEARSGIQNPHPVAKNATRMGHPFRVDQRPKTND